MKTLKVILGIFTFALLLQSCTGDIEDLEDPRDAIVNKKFRVVEQEIGSDIQPRSYDDEIKKDSNEKTGIIFSNFNERGLKVKATLAGNGITIKKQTLNGIIVEGSGTITSDLKDINLTYTVDEEGGANPIRYTANYSEPQVSKSMNPLEIKPIRQIN